MNKLDCRRAFTDTLLTLAREDPRLFAVATDSRGSVTLTDFADELPSQFVECGIAEQDAVGIAAGLANGGQRPFVCGPACFYTLRSAEQVKVDVAYSHQNVKVIGVSGGVSYGALGSTHHSTHDVALLRAIPGMEVFIPSDARQTAALTRYLARSAEPAYMRMGRGAVPVIYGDACPCVPGRANQLREGGDVSILACGETVWHALQAAEELAAEGISSAVWDMFSLRPLDVQAVLKAADTPLVVTVEEHSIHGGLGSAVSEVLAQQKPTRMLILGIPDENTYHGTSTEVFRHYQLDGEGIAQQIRQSLRK